MELLQTIDVKSVESGQKKSSIQVADKSTDSTDALKNKPFEEQLNDQVEQLKSNVDDKKNKPNQQDKESVSDQTRIVVDMQDSTEEQYAETNQLEESSAEVTNLSEIGQIKAQQIGALANPIIATTASETGNILPPDSPQTSTFTTEKSATVSAIGIDEKTLLANTSKPMGIQQAEITSELSDDKFKTATAKLGGNLSGINEKIINGKTEIEAPLSQKPLNAAINLSVSLAEKSTLQDTRYSKINTQQQLTSDQITQASRQQQVPVVSAMSASLSSTQNTMSSVLADAAATLNNNTTVNNASLNTLNASIPVNINNQNWAQQMTQQVSYMIKGGFQQAAIKLNPAHLGPMEIKLAINDDQATVNFVAQHAPVRDVLDAALPRLKDMFEQQGLNLADADVSAQSEQQQQASSEAQQEKDELALSNSSSNDNETSVETNKVMSISVDAGVSIFA